MNAEQNWEIMKYFSPEAKTNYRILKFCCWKQIHLVCSSDNEEKYWPVTTSKFFWGNLWIMNWSTSYATGSFPWLTSSLTYLYSGDWLRHNGTLYGRLEGRGHGKHIGHTGWDSARLPYSHGYPQHIHLDLGFKRDKYGIKIFIHFTVYSTIKMGHTCNRKNCCKSVLLRQNSSCESKLWERSINYEQ